MKTKFLCSALICLIFCVSNAVSQTKSDLYGFYVTKDDYLNKKVTVLDQMQESENYNVGQIKYKYQYQNFDPAKNKEPVILIVDCIKKKYWGFHYLDGFDYMLLDGFYAKIVITGRIDLLVSPKASFKIDEKGHYTFSLTDKGKINYYFMKDLDASTVAPFEKRIADEKPLLKAYQADKDNYGDFINKQLVYLKQYNDIIPKVKKGNRK